MKPLALFPLCRVDLPDIRKWYDKCFPIWGSHLHTDKKEIQEEGEKVGKKGER